MLPIDTRTSHPIALLSAHLSLPHLRFLVMGEREEDNHWSQSDEEGGSSRTASSDRELVFENAQKNKKSQENSIEERIVPNLLVPATTASSCCA